jgi:hypothetical protein
MKKPKITRILRPYTEGSLFDVRSWIPDVRRNSNFVHRTSTIVHLCSIRQLRKKSIFKMVNVKIGTPQYNG